MTKSFNVSDEVRNIIRKFNQAFNANRGILTRMAQPINTLAVSLYALKQDARKDVLGMLHDYNLNLYHYLSAEDISILLENYSDVVKYLMFSSRPNIVTSNGWCNLPIEIPQLCQALAECKEGSRVLLPYAGDGTIAACLPAGCDVYGFEENRELWATANIYMDAIGIKSNLQLEENVDNNQQYDYIFCFPPLLKGIEMREIIGRLRDLALHNLTADGEMYCILPKSFCGTINWLDLRKLPLENNGEYSTMVISLPEGLLYPISGIQLCLFHLKRNFDNQVILVNASDESFLSHKVMTNGNSRETVGVSLKVNSILETIDSRDADYVWSGDIIRLFEMSQDLDMTPSRYISVIRDVQFAIDERMVSLKELIEILPIKRIPNAPKEIPTIGARELYSNYIYCDIPYDKISVEGKSSSRFNTRIITQDCLLMCFVGGKFKVARLKGVSESHPVALAQWIIPFVISSTSVDEDFLLRCITSAFVEKQAKALVKGTYIKTIRIDDYGNLTIILPSLDKQKLLCIEDTRIGLSEADRKKLEREDEFRKDMHMKKHAIGQTIFNINNWWSLLKLAREKGNGIVNDSAELGITRKVKVADIYANLEIAMDKLSIQLSKFDTGYGLKAENIPLTEFIEKYISQHQNPMFDYIYDPKPHRADCDMLVIEIGEKPKDEYIHREGDPLEYVVFPKEALTTIFDNIISNACAHGFTMVGPDDINIIRIEILQEGTDCVIEISNNGYPIKDLSSQDVLTYGVTTKHSKTTDPSTNHFGIGGYEIKKLMTEFGGDVEIVSTPDEEFTVTYRLIFHNTTIKM